MTRRRLCEEGRSLPGIVCVSGPLSGGVARLRLCPTRCFPSVIVLAYFAPEGVGATSTQRLRPYQAEPHRLAGSSVACQPCHSSRHPPGEGDVGCAWAGARRLHCIFLQSYRVSTPTRVARMAYKHRMLRILYHNYDKS